MKESASEVKAAVAEKTTAVKEAVEEKTAVKNLLEKAKLPVEIPEYIDREALVKKLYTDKKVRDGKLRFVVEKGIGGIVEFEEGVFATPVEEAVARDIIMKMK